MGGGQLLLGSDAGGWRGAGQGSRCCYESGLSVRVPVKEDVTVQAAVRREGLLSWGPLLSAGTFYACCVLTSCLHFPDRL